MSKIYSQIWERTKIMKVFAIQPRNKCFAVAADKQVIMFVTKDTPPEVYSVLEVKLIYKVDKVYQTLVTDKLSGEPIFIVTHDELEEANEEMINHFWPITELKPVKKPKIQLNLFN